MQGSAVCYENRRHVHVTRQQSLEEGANNVGCTVVPAEPSAQMQTTRLYLLAESRLPEFSDVSNEILFLGTPA